MVDASRMLIAGLLAMVWSVGASAADAPTGAPTPETERFAEEGTRSLRAFDYAEACKWYALAAAFGDEIAERRFKAVSRLLTLDEHRNCLAAARAWRPDDGYGGDDTDPLRGYYDDARGKTGEALRAALHGIVSRHRQLSYADVWAALEHTDEDPDDAANVMLLYTGRSQPKARREQGQNDGDAWNREHVWPHSHGFPTRNQRPHTDLHHLRPADVSVNADRGNLDFDVGGMPHGEALGARIDGDSFEPPDRVKGDVARMVFYMDVRYEGGDGEPDLVVVPGQTRVGEPRLGRLCTLVAWHRADPVNAWERRRNDRIHERQGNRNPFIDHPEWVDELWGGDCD